jgi:hypothetical protein
MLIGPSPGRYLFVKPASTRTVDPVMWRPVSDTRCKIVFVTSSGSINPFSTGSGFCRFCRDGGELLDKAPEGFVVILGELTPVRCTVLTRIPSWRKRIRPRPYQTDDTVLGSDVTHHPGVSVRHAPVEARG